MVQGDWRGEHAVAIPGNHCGVMKMDDDNDITLAMTIVMMTMILNYQQSNGILL